MNIQSFIMPGIELWPSILQPRYNSRLRIWFLPDTWQFQEYVSRNPLIVPVQCTTTRSIQFSVSAVFPTTTFRLLYAFFCVVPRRLNFICRRFGTLCLFHLHRQVGVEWLGWEMLGYLYGKRFGIFSSQTFARINTPTFLSLVILHLPAYEDGTECSETSAYKIQAPGNCPKKAYNIQNKAKVWNQ
jgi:hypothetical protein